MIDTTSQPDTAALSPSERVIYDVPLDRLFPSPTQPRRRNRAGADLVESVMELGVIEPILARPAPERDGYWEIVFGERRWAASRAAGLTTVPTEIRELTDREVLQLQHIENAQRADVGPIEEAASYELMQRDLALLPAEIARLVHRSLRHVLQRLRLLTLPPDAQEAVEEGRLPMRAALKISELQDADDRQAAADDALVRLTAGWAPGVLCAHIEHRWHLRLATAQWALDDATLLPRAGSCTRCPKRSGAQIALWAEGDAEDLCTDRPCFEAKTAAHWARVSEAAATQGARVLEGREADAVLHNGRARDELVELDEPCDLLVPGSESGKPRTWRAELGDALPPSVVARDDFGRVHELVDVKAATDALVKAGKIPPAARAAQRPDPNELARAADRKIELQARHAAEKRLIAAVVKGVETQKATAPLWLLCIECLVRMLDFMHFAPILQRRGVAFSDDKGDAEELLRYAATLKEGAARGLVFELLATEKLDYEELDDDAMIGRMARLFKESASKTLAEELKKAKSAAARARRRETATSEHTEQPRRDGGTKASPAARTPTKKPGKAKASKAPSAAPAESDADILVEPIERTCVVCSCTDSWGCDSGCAWASPELCTVCAATMDAIEELLVRRPLTRQALIQQLKEHDDEHGCEASERAPQAVQRLIELAKVVERHGKIALKHPPLLALDTKPKGKKSSAAVRAETP